MDGTLNGAGTSHPDKQILRSAYPTDFVSGAPSHPKDLDLSVGPRASTLRSATVWFCQWGLMEKQENGGAVSPLSHNPGYDD